MCLVVAVSGLEIYMDLCTIWASAIDPFVYAGVSCTLHSRVDLYRWCDSDDGFPNSYNRQSFRNFYFLIFKIHQSLFCRERLYFLHIFRLKQ